MKHRGRIKKTLIIAHGTPWYWYCLSCTRCKWFTTWEAALNTAVNHYNTKRFDITERWYSR